MLMPDSLEDINPFGTSEPPLVTEVNKEVPTFDKSWSQTQTNIRGFASK